MKNLPHITTKQQTILKLLYRYRFLDRIQIQAFMGHTDKRRSSRWLKDLREKQYIEWIYDKNNFAEKTKPAIYYLDLNGIRYLRTLEKHPTTELSKRYKEATRQPGFMARCLLIADCGINLTAKTVGRTRYMFVTAADYINPDNDYTFLAELQPHLCFVKQTPSAKKSYLLEVFDSTTPRYMVKKRIKDYLEYLCSGDWEEETEDEKPPIVLLACQTKAELIYVKRRIRKVLVENFEPNEDIHLRVTTTDKLKLQGITDKIWEEVKIDTD